MKQSAVIVLVLCLIASVLVAAHQMTCEQKAETTTKCDVAYIAPVIVLVAVACGIAGLAVLAVGENRNGGGN